ncbi:MAG: hypothetical protein RL198_104, partial [Actinomycetota bacterium]
AESTTSQRYRIDIAYDGTDFAGWAKQPNLNTVAGSLLSALEVVLGADAGDFGLRVAGRTDAGVHSSGQVAHIDVSQAQLNRAGRSGLTARRLNDLLPSTIRVKSLTAVSSQFDARFAALQRSYRYRIADRPECQLPQTARQTLWHPKSLDEHKMQLAAQLLIGLHDFAAFCKPREGATTIRELRSVKVERDESLIINIDITADAFCHNMVRSLVGALIAVGEGRLSEAELSEVLKGKIRSSRFKVVSPQGLTLTAVNYPPEAEWKEQVSRARNRRDEEANWV